MQSRNEGADWRETRRMQAWELKQRGWKQRQIADALGVTEGAVSQWMKRAAEEGEAGLRRHRPRGAEPRLSAAQRVLLAELLARGARAHGFVDDGWTQSRVRTLIMREFGVEYHRDHIGRLLRSIGWHTEGAQGRSAARVGRER
jgi:transposase